jgi:hypothetical protein
MLMRLLKKSMAFKLAARVYETIEKEYWLLNWLLDLIRLLKKSMAFELVVRSNYFN